MQIPQPKIGLHHYNFSAIPNTKQAENWNKLFVFSLSFQRLYLPRLFSIFLFRLDFIVTEWPPYSPLKNTYETSSLMC